MLIDSHAHLDMHQFAGDLDSVLERARAAGVGEILTIGYDTASFDKALALCEAHEMVYAALGVHPHNATEYDDAADRRLKDLLLRGKVLAVGEIGLDYYRDLSPRERQREAFRRQIGLALYFDTPIVVHARESFEDVIRILEEEGAAEVGGIFHAFSGGLDEAKAVLDLGFLVGIGGPLTYKNSKLPQVARRLPSAAIVLETDCPYLPPAPYRGKRNEPAYVGLVAERLAEIRGVDKEDIERMAETNYRALLHEDIPEPCVAYMIKGNCYINVTPSCTNACVFCPRPGRGRFLYGHNLNIAYDPSAEEMIEAARAVMAQRSCREIVFCGFGEPTTRLADILEAATALRSAGTAVRLDTNGQGSMINRRNIVPELETVFDAVSVSLGAPDRAAYAALCRPDMESGAFDAVVDFIKRTAASRMSCEVTALDLPGVDIAACRSLVEAIPGAAFRERQYHVPISR
jgi:TatD DNase family protein